MRYLVRPIKDTTTYQNLIARSIPNGFRDIYTNVWKQVAFYTLLKKPVNIRGRATFTYYSEENNMP